MDPGRQEQHRPWMRLSYTDLPPSQTSQLRDSLPGHPFLFLMIFFSSKLKQTSLRLSHQLHLFLSGSNRPHRAAEEELWRWERLDHTGKTSGSGFGGFSPVPALALTDS